jgi:cytochrome P450
MDWNTAANRLVVEPVAVRDVTFRPGTYLTLCIGAANRDSEEFKNPDRFDIARYRPAFDRHEALVTGPQTMISSNFSPLTASTAKKGGLMYTSRMRPPPVVGSL